MIGTPAVVRLAQAVLAAATFSYATDTSARCGHGQLRADGGEWLMNEVYGFVPNDAPEDVVGVVANAVLWTARDAIAEAIGTDGDVHCATDVYGQAYRKLGGEAGTGGVRSRLNDRAEDWREALRTLGDAGHPRAARTVARLSIGA